MNWIIKPLEWLFKKFFDKNTPLSRVIIIMIFIMFLIASALTYIIITDEEEVKIEKAVEKVN